jgi:hypothetical protein
MARHFTKKTADRLIEICAVEISGFGLDILKTGTTGVSVKNSRLFAERREYSKLLN